MQIMHSIRAPFLPVTRKVRIIRDTVSKYCTFDFSQFWLFFTKRDRIMRSYGFRGLIFWPVAKRRQQIWFSGRRQQHLSFLSVVMLPDIDSFRWSIFTTLTNLRERLINKSFIMRFWSSGGRIIRSSLNDVRLITHGNIVDGYDLKL